MAPSVVAEEYIKGRFESRVFTEQAVDILKKKLHYGNQARGKNAKGSNALNWWPIPRELLHANKVKEIKWSK